MGGNKSWIRDACDDDDGRGALQHWKWNIIISNGNYSNISTATRNI